MEEARCCAILDEAIEELLTQVVKKEVKLQDQRIRRPPGGGPAERTGRRVAPNQLARPG